MLLHVRPGRREQVRPIVHRVGESARRQPEPARNRCPCAVSPALRGAGASSRVCRRSRRHPDPFITHGMKCDLTRVARSICAFARRAQARAAPQRHLLGENICLARMSGFRSGPCWRRTRRRACGPSPRALRASCGPTGRTARPTRRRRPTARPETELYLARFQCFHVRTQALARAHTQGNAHFSDGRCIGSPAQR